MRLIPRTRCVLVRVSDISNPIPDCIELEIVLEINQQLLILVVKNRTLSVSVCIVVHRSTYDLF